MVKARYNAPLLTSSLPQSGGYAIYEGGIADFEHSKRG